MQKKQIDEKDLHKGHRERLRNKLFAAEDDDILTHEMLEVMLFYALPRVNTNPIAHRLIKMFGSVERVLCADKDELTKIDGIGERSAEYLIMLGKFMRTYARSCYRNITYNIKEQETQQYLHNLFRDMDKEVVYLLCLDGAYKLKKESLIIEGSFENVEVDIGSMVRVALPHSPKYVVCVHNHPSGIAKASEADREAMDVMRATFNLVGIKLYDSVIVAGNRLYSIESNLCIEIE